MIMEFIDVLNKCTFFPTGPSYEEMDGKFYVDRNGSLRTITRKDDDDDDIISCCPFNNGLR